MKHCIDTNRDTNIGHTFTNSHYNGICFPNLIVDIISLPHSCCTEQPRQPEGDALFHSGELEEGHGCERYECGVPGEKTETGAWIVARQGGGVDNGIKCNTSNGLLCPLRRAWDESRVTREGDDILHHVCRVVSCGCVVFVGCASTSIIHMCTLL